MEAMNGAVKRVTSDFNQYLCRVFIERVSSTDMPEGWQRDESALNFFIGCGVALRAVDRMDLGWQVEQFTIAALAQEGYSAIVKRAEAKVISDILSSDLQ